MTAWPEPEICVRCGRTIKDTDTDVTYRPWARAAGEPFAAAYRPADGMMREFLPFCDECEPPGKPSVIDAD